MATSTETPGQTAQSNQMIQLNVLPLEPPQPKVILNILPLPEEEPRTSTTVLPVANPNSRLLKERHPEIFAQIHPTKNDGVDLDKLTYASNKKLWWSCSKSRCVHHVWEAAIYSRTSNRGCPFCAKQRTCPCDSFIRKFPHLIEEFKPELNPRINIQELSSGSNQVLKWSCKNVTCGHHIWEASIKTRTADHGCPFCFGFQTCPCDAFATKFPHLIAELDLERNQGVNILAIPAASHQKLWWKCSNAQCQHHKWEASVKNRVNDTGCPFCNHKQTCPCDAFVTKFPYLVTEFIPELNPGIDPLTISSGSSIKLWWKCSKALCNHHIWSTSVYERTQGGDCPYCNHKQTCICDSFPTKHPQLAQEFIQELNPDINPLTISPGSGIKLWWKCSKAPDKNHIWSARVYDRKNGHGCPHCKTSQLEDSTIEILMNLKIASERQKRFEKCFYINLLPFDVHLPDYNALIETDGIQHFEEIPFFQRQSGAFALQQQKDQIKNTFCRENGIHLLRISYSELDNVATHIQSFIEAIKAASPGQRIEMFMGVEYQQPTPVQTT